MRAHAAVVALGAAALAGIGALCGLMRWGTRWGSTPDERKMALPGDPYLQGGPPTRVAMSRAITVSAPPEAVWPWLAQLGRGAGFYSFDRLDNGNRTSARHVVSWIPDPALGDATAIGYLRHVEQGTGLTWWVPGDRFLGATVRLVFDIHLQASGACSRVVIRVSGDASGPTAVPVLIFFQALDSIMARRQLLGLKGRIESPPLPAIDAESGARDQYQLYEVLYAAGGGAGVPGKEKGATWRWAAITDGILAPVQTPAPSAHTSS